MERYEEIGCYSGERTDWIARLTAVIDPVLRHAAARTLCESMPLAAAPGFEEPRSRSSHLEAVVRCLLGAAPWLEKHNGGTFENSLREQYVDAARAALASLFDPASADFCDVASTRQGLVEAALLGQAIRRAPSTLLGGLDQTAEARLVKALQGTRVHEPHANNWLLFSATVEATLAYLGEDWREEPIDRALERFEAWYKGDGAYGDGAWFRWDYYNSIIIHPLLLDLLSFCERHLPRWAHLHQPLIDRSQRMARVLERFVAPDGTFAPVGRSLAYRCGTMHLLAHLALEGLLPEDLAVGRVRGVLYRVIVRTLDAPGTFDRHGWLRIGLSGHQPELAETYISTGSLYLCTAAFLPLGLDDAHDFWTTPEGQSSWEAIWAGGNVGRDQALQDPPTERVKPTSRGA